MSHIGPNSELTNFCLSDIKNLIESTIKLKSFFTQNKTSRTAATPFKTTPSASISSKYRGNVFNKIMPMPAFYSRDNTPIKSV